MAIFVCEFSSISRNGGRSAVAAAAYRAGEKIKNEWDGVEHDFTHKQNVLYKEILLPPEAPQKYQERSVLWNAVEMSGTARDSRLARECLVALPVEMSTEQQIELVRSFVNDQFVSLGMCADVAIHNPPEMDDLGRCLDENGQPTNDPQKYRYNNPHAHILLSVRNIDANGKWEKKSQVEYLCKRGDEQKAMTAAELSTAGPGWEKQYRYRVDGKAVWMTPSEASDLDLTAKDRINRSPLTNPRGRENPKTAFWNDKQRIVEWRQAWQDAVNQQFEKLKIDARVDCRSYAERGIDRMPGCHLGPEANNMRKRSERLTQNGKKNTQPPEKVKYNVAADEYNRTACQYQKAETEIKTKIHATALRLESLKSGMVQTQAAAAALSKATTAKQKETDDKAADIRNILASIEAMLSLNASAESSIANLTKLLNSCSPLQVKKQKELKEQIVAEQQQINERKAYIQSEMQKRGYSDGKALRTAEQKQKQARASVQKQKTQIDKLRSDYSAQEAEYTSAIESVPVFFKSALERDRADIRQSMVLNGNLDSEVKIPVNRENLSLSSIKDTNTKNKHKTLTRAHL